MDSHEVLRRSVSGAGVKSVASDMNLSPSLIYKWCEAKGEDRSGADNPLDRLLRLCEATGERAPVIWLCERLDGLFVENVPPEASADELQVLAMTQRILREFSEMLDKVSSSMANDERIDAREAAEIRSEWEDLKRVGEQFVRGCEAGCYDREAADPPMRAAP